MKRAATFALAISLFVAGPAAAEFAVGTLYFECGADCRAVRDKLAEADTRDLANVPAEVTETLAVIRDTPGLTAEAAASAVAAKLAKGPFDGDYSKVRSGTRACTVYWFGFLDTASQRVGTHRCRVTVEGDRLSVEKLTGDGLRAEVFPYAGPVRAFVGRSFLPHQLERDYDREKPDNARNENYGNEVGLVLADKGRLFLIDISERGFSEPDRSFFAVLAID